MSERGEVKRDGASAQKNSGRGPYQKGDARWRGFLVDYKEYPKGIRITPDMWGKVCSDAMKTDRASMPVLKVIMESGGKKIRLAVIEWSVLEELTDGREVHNRTGV